MFFTSAAAESMRFEAVHSSTRGSFQSARWSKRFGLLISPKMAAESCQQKKVFTESEMSADTNGTISTFKKIDFDGLHNRNFILLSSEFTNDAPNDANYLPHRSPW